MAVIRETRQFQVGKIGVARASRAGAITGEAMSNFGRTLQAQAYEFGAEAAQKYGVDQANAIEAADVIALDPETGKPRVYNGPSGMGSIARNAYQNVVLNRFQQEISTEIQNKSQELALKYRRSPSGYETAMGDYLAQMSNVEQTTVFKNTITSIGGDLMARTSASLKAEAIARQEASDRAAHANARRENLAAIESLAASGKFDEAAHIADQGAALDATYVNGGAVLAGAVAGNSKDRRDALLRGSITAETRNAIQGNYTAEDIARVQAELDIGIISPLAVEMLPKTASMLSGSDAVTVMELGQYMAEPAEDASRIIQIRDAEAYRERMSRAEEEAQGANKLFFNTMNLAPSEASASLAGAITSYNNDIIAARNAFGRGATADEIASYTAGSTTRITSIVRGMSSQLLGEMNSVADVTAVQQYLANPTEDNLASVFAISNDAGTLVMGFTDAQKAGIDIFGPLDKQLEGYTDTVRFNEETKANNAALDMAYEYENSFLTRIKTASTPEEIAQVASSFSAQVSGSGMSAAAREPYGAAISNEVSEAYMRLAYATAGKASVAAEMSNYLIDPSQTGSLTETQRNLLDLARENSKSDSDMATNINRYNGVANTRIQSAEARATRNQFHADAVNGRLDGTSQDVRETIDANYNIPSDYFTNPERKTDNLDFVIQSAGVSALPQSFVNTADRAAAGRLTANELSHFMEYYGSLTRMVLPSGETTFSQSYSGMNETTFAKLETVFAKFTETGDINATVNYLNTVNRAYGNPAHVKAMKDLFEDRGGLNAALFAEFGSLMSNPIVGPRITAIAQQESIIGLEEGRDAKNILGRVSDYVDSIYVDDEYVGGKTLYPLDMITGGNGEAFQTYVRDQARLYGDSSLNVEETRLTPLGYRDTNGGMAYALTATDENGNDYVPVMNIPVTQADGSISTVAVPAFFSTSEPHFRAIIERNVNLAAKAELIRAEIGSQQLVRTTEQGIEASSMIEAISPTDNTALRGELAAATGELKAATATTSEKIYGMDGFRDITLQVVDDSQHPELEALPELRSFYNAIPGRQPKDMKRALEYVRLEAESRGFTKLVAEMNLLLEQLPKE